MKRDTGVIGAGIKSGVCRVLSLCLLPLLLLAGCASDPGISEDQLSAEEVAMGVTAPVEEPWVEPLSEQQATSLKEARAAWAESDFGKARRILEKLLQARPDHPDLLTNAAIIAREQGRTDSARTLFEEALKVYPGHRVASNNLALVLREQGEPLEARKVLTRALQLHPEEPTLHYNLAIIYELYLQDLEQALNHYRRAQSLAPEPDPEVAGWITDLERRVE